MRVDTRPRKRNAGRPAEKSAPSYLQWLRGRACACKGRNPVCGGKMVAAHVDHAGDKGMGTKVSDRHAIPLSWNCHGRQHLAGWHTFEREYLGGADAVQMAAAYWAQWPGRREWEARNGTDN
jgi:hypothetical protein